jgi:hypothetical protein
MLNKARLYDVDYWSLPREMAMDDALRDIAARIILGDEHGARMTAIEVLTRLEPRTQEHENAIHAKLEPLPFEGSVFPYGVLPGGDPQWDYVIPADELQLLRRRDAEHYADMAARLAKYGDDPHVRSGKKLAIAKYLHEQMNDESEADRD